MITWELKCKKAIAHWFTGIGFKLKKKIKSQARDKRKGKTSKRKYMPLSEKAPSKSYEHMADGSYSDNQERDFFFLHQ